MFICFFIKLNVCAKICLFYKQVCELNTLLLNLPSKKFVLDCETRRGAWYSGKSSVDSGNRANGVLFVTGLIGDSIFGTIVLCRSSQYVSW